MALWKFLVSPNTERPKAFEILPVPGYKIKKKFRFTIPWKIRIQRQTTRKLLGQGTKSEKWWKLQLEYFFLSFFLFFCFLRFIFIIFYIYTGSFQVLPKKITPSQSANSHPKFQQFDLISYYINLKNGSISSDNAAEVLYIRKNRLERLLDKKSTCNFVYSIQCIQWQNLFKKA